ncbi:MAG TPA: cadherin repeat domain-containing protein, partial [Cellvibrionaceae bacterium]|nr:cadherin repeat domain-containing protein [Cellvibrionaceae bacterium]
MIFPFPVTNLSKALFSSCFAFALCALAGCDGGVLKFTAGTSASVKVPENTDGKVWQASVVLDGPGSLTGLSYRLSGPDQDRFSINTATGEVSLREAADFEQPGDADKNNEYRVTIEASANKQTVVQSLQVQVTDVSLPKVELVQPKLNENIAKGADFTAQAVVRLYDAESNQTLSGGAVYLNGQALQQDAKDTQLFTGILSVPTVGIDISLVSTFDGGHSISAQGKIFNKLSALSPDIFGVNPGFYLFYLDKTDASVSKMNLANGISQHYVQDRALASVGAIFDFNSSYQTAYLAVEEGVGASLKSHLYAFPVGKAIPKVFSAGCTTDKILNLAYDGLNKRVLLVAQDNQASPGGYSVLAIGVDEANGFVNGEYMGDCKKALEAGIVWRIPESVIKGKFKQFAFHRVSGTFVLADERM